MATPNIVPRADSEGGLGTASKYWASAYIDFAYVGKIGRDTDNYISFELDNYITINVGGTTELTLNATNLYPQTSDGLALGKSDKMFSDLFLASGAVINFDNGNATITHSNNRLKINDSTELALGDGQDLKIYHDGSNTYIDNSTGIFRITQSVADGDLVLRADNGSGSPTPYLTLDGGLGYSIASKAIRFADGVRAYFGNSNDAEILHNGTNFAIQNLQGGGDMKIINYVDDTDIIFSNDDGSGGVTAYLTLDGSAVETVFSKAGRFADNVKARFGNGGDMYLQHDGTDSAIVNTNGNLTISNQADDKDVIFQCDDGAGGSTTYFYLDGSSATHDGSATTALYTNFPDKSHLTFGTSHDLQIDHDGNHSVIYNQTGHLYISNDSNDGDIVFRSDDGSGGVTQYFRLDGGVGYMIASREINFLNSQPATFGTNRNLTISHSSTQGDILNYTGPFNITNHANDGDLIFSSDDGSGGVTAYLTLDGSEVSTKILTQKVIMSNLPTSDPTNAGQLWNDSGTLKVSAG